MHIFLWLQHPLPHSSFSFTIIISIITITHSSEIGGAGGFYIYSIFFDLARIVQLTLIRLEKKLYLISTRSFQIIMGVNF
jgi:hypothetical protein